MTEFHAPPPSYRGPAWLHVIWLSLKDWAGDWFNQFLLHLTLLLSWLTIIFGPPMLFGFYYLAYDLVHGRSNDPMDLIKASKRFFWTSWRWMLLNLLVSVILIVNIQFYWSLARWWSIMLTAVFLFLGLFWAMMQLYVIPYFMVQESKSLLLAVKNAGLTFLAAPGYTLLLFLFSIGLIITSLVFILPLILALPSLALLIGVHAVIDRTQAYGVIKQ